MVSSSIFEGESTCGAEARVGAVLAGKWALEALLGVGGMGAVYRGRHRNGHRVAIKVLHPMVARDRRLVARLERESRLANRVEHPAIVRALDDGVTDDGCPFLVSELVEGETLEGMRRAKGGALAFDDVLRTGDELLDALEAAHAAGVLHRDIKPANLMRVTTTGELKILDFGLGREVAPVGGDDGGSMTSDFATLGTVGYMAPEQAQGRGDLVDATTDLWAVAATLLKLATGLDAHDAETPQTRLALAATQPTTAIRSRTDAVPAAVADVLDRALSFSKRDRFPDAHAFRDALRAAALRADDVPGGPAAASKSTPASARRAPARWSVLGLLGIAAAAAFVALASPWRRSAASGGAQSSAAQTTTAGTAPEEPSAIPSAAAARAENPPASAEPSALPSGARRDVASAASTTRPRAVSAPQRPSPPSASAPLERPPPEPVPTIDPMDRRR